ncbi:unnamed protein product [Scytosiphon promiscuus]
MMATRPSSTEDSGAAAAATTQEEKSIPGVSGNALKEERQPLLDLDDVEQLESELAACFDAPPPPPLNIRQEEQIATVSAWTPAAQPRYVETYVAPPTASVVAAAEARGDLPQPQHQQAGEAEQRRDGGERQQQQRASTRVSDFSNLYSATPHRAIVDICSLPPLGKSVCLGVALPRGRVQPPLLHCCDGTETRSRGEGMPPMATPFYFKERPGRTPLSSITTATAVRQRDLAAGDVSSSNEVVEELLSENERLRLIIQDMYRGGLRGAGGRRTMRVAGRRGRGSSYRRTTGAGAVSATPAQRLLGRYPGAQAEAAR